MKKNTPKSQENSSKPEKADKLIPVTLLKNGYIHGELVKAGETVKIPESLKKSLVSSSPEVYK